MAERRVPRIRFKGFEEDWEQRKLEEIVIFNPKANIPEIFEYVDLEAVVGTEMISHRSESKRTAPSRAQRLAQVGDLFYQTVRPYQKNNYLFERSDGYYVFSTGYAQMRPLVSGEFLLSLIQNEEFVKVVLDKCTGTSYPAINVKDLGRITVFLPKLSCEQRQIGRVSKYLDSLLSLHQRKLEKLKILKKAMLEKMFPKNGEKVPEIRFSGFTDDWEQRKLGELADIVGGGTPSTSNLQYWDGDIDWYAPAEINEQVYISSSQKKITKAGYENSSVKLLPVGTVLFTSRAGIGKTAILDREACTNQGFQSIVPHKQELDSYFIFSRSAELKQYGEIVGAGSTFVEVSGKQMSEMELMMPLALNEQQAIGTYFRRLDQLLSLHQRKLEKLRQIKKSMLERMFV